MTEHDNLIERILIALPWVSVPLLALHFVSLLNELPQRMPVHFDLQGHPNGWQSPTTSAIFSCGALLFSVAIFSFAMMRAFRARALYGTVVIAGYSATAIMFTLLWQTLDHAAYGRPMSAVWPMPLAIPIVGLVVAAVCLPQLSPERAQPSLQAMTIAEEQHRSLAQLLFVAPGILIGLWLVINGMGVPRFLGIFLVAIMGWVATAVLDGFRYLVRTDGVQIKGFLLPLRFVPRTSIRSYRTQPWNGLGYGIRLTSTGTAYIWGGRQVVNIVTDSGDVMLGHSDPERLIRDLDQMMQATH